jgi:hypothetical protein
MLLSKDYEALMVVTDDSDDHHLEELSLLTTCLSG